MFQQVIENAKIFMEGCKDNSNRIELLEVEANAFKHAREGILKGRRKGDSPINPQIELMIKIERELEAMSRVN